MWNHFTSKSSTVVQCNICKDELAFAGGTGSMKNHMRAKHPSVILTAETSASSGIEFGLYFILCNSLHKLFMMSHLTFMSVGHFHGPVRSK